jgi:hypothetical protein
LLFFIFGNYLFLEKNAVGAIIDFEDFAPPGPPPDDGEDKTPIGTQYLGLGVEFYLSNQSLPNLELVGDVDSFAGFWNDLKGAPDIEADGFVGALGNYYLRLGFIPLQPIPVPSLIMQFSTPVSEVSGEIWDIDATAAIPGYEQWEITARDLTGLELDSDDSPVGVDVITDPTNSFDGKPWEWSLASVNGDISFIEIRWIGTKESGIGLAMDNFEITAVPIPGAIWLFGSGILGMVFIRRRLKN